MATSSTPQRELAVIAVPFSGGQGKPGVSQAPTFLQNAGLLTQLSTDLNYKVHHTTLPPPPFTSSYEPNASSNNPPSDPPASLQTELSPDPPHRGMKNPRAVSHITRLLADEAYAHASAGRLVLTLGGDHSVAMGSVAGISRAVRERGEGEVGVIWVDAHADINTPEISESGNVHGMPVAWLTGLAQNSLPSSSPTSEQKQKPEQPVLYGHAKEGAPTAVNGTEANDAAHTRDSPFSWLPTSPPALNLKNLVYIGLRDVDRAEKAILKEYGIKAFSMHDIDRHGIAHIISLALAHLDPSRPIHLSFDVDALDPSYAPSTGTPVRGGLTLREGDFIAECVWATGRVVGMDLVEVNPGLGVGAGEVTEMDRRAAEETVRAGVSLVRAGLGDTLL